MSEHAGEYALSEGPSEAHRLAVLSGVMSGATGRLLEAVGVAPGWRCLDVGSGGGQVTLALGELVGPSGSVVGVDTSAAAVAAAQAAAEAAGLAQVRFEVGDVAGLADSGDHDLAYARLLLLYLTEPAAALRSMLRAVRPGGVVAVEDIFTDDLRSEPETPALADLRRVFGATVRARGGDPTIGPRLPALFDAAGLVDVEATSVVNALRTAEEKAFLVELLASMHDAVLETGSATEAELASMTAAIQRAADDDGVTFYQARTWQVWGRRPA